jgi:DNA-binding response OmpR family regulator
LNREEAMKEQFGSVAEPIWEERNEMSQGTKFPTVPVAEVPKPGSQLGPGASRPVVLVVDDESVITDTLAEILNRSGYTAIPAYDGEEALETALLMPPELLLTDVMLPGMSGIELAVKVKRIFPDCKVLLFSGQAATTDMLAAATRDGHRFDLLTKPLHPKDLLLHVAAGLKRREGKPAMAVS